MRSCCLFLVIIAVTSLWKQPVFSQDTCDALARAIQESTNDFANIRGAVLDRDDETGTPESWDSQWNVPGFSNCSIQRLINEYYMSCYALATRDASQLEPTYASSVQQISHCLSVPEWYVKQEPINGKDYSGKQTRWGKTNESVTLQLKQRSGGSARHTVTLTIERR
jgi:hypothetical protein